MKSKSKLQLLAKVWGLIFTFFLLLAVGPKIIISFFEDPRLFIADFQNSISDPLNPSFFFYTYILGYILVWWKPFWGSVIIILTSIYYVAVAGFNGPPIFAAPGFLVGALYFTYWYVKKRNTA